MPSCDGSNCGACSACSTKVVKEYVHLDKEEREDYESRIEALKNELKRQKKINKKLQHKIEALEVDCDYDDR